MGTPNQGNKDEAPGQNKEVKIIVNGREKVFVGKKISFAQVVELAFGVAPNSDTTIYTVTYKRGEEKKPEGSMVDGDSIPVKDGMVFNVTQTNKS